MYIYVYFTPEKVGGDEGSGAGAGIKASNVILFAKQKQRHRCREQTCGHQGGKRWWREEMEGQDWQTYSADTVRQISKENLGTAQGTLHALWWPKGKEILKRAETNTL